MFTELKLKRICKKFKAPELDIPELAPAPRKRPRLKPVFATAALALVIVGASVIGIKGNIFKGEQPLPPVDIDTPDTPDTPTPPDTDTPTPPEDDVKIIYDEKTNFAGGGLATFLSKRLLADERLLDAMDSEEYEDCKFALYLYVGDTNAPLSKRASEMDERYRLLSEMESACSELSNKVRYYFQDFSSLTENDRKRMLDNIFDGVGEKKGSSYVSFEHSSRQITEYIDEYARKYGDDFFKEDELETARKFLSLTREDFYNEETVEIYEAFRRVYSYNWHWRKYEYTDAITSQIVEYFKSFGVKVKPVDLQEVSKIIQITSDPIGLYETNLTKDELYTLAEALENDYAKTEIGYYCQAFWRSE